VLPQSFRTVCERLHDHRDNTWGWTAYSRPRLQIGRFSLHPVGKLTGCQWRKDLWNAELTGTITTDRGEIRIRHFTHAEDMVIVTELSPSAGEKGFTWTWHPVAAQTTRGGYPRDAKGIPAFAKKYGSHYLDTLKPFKPNPPGRLETEDGVTVWVQDFLVGGQYATAWKEEASGGTRTHVVSIAHSFPAATASETAVAEVKLCLKKDRKDVVAVHRRWWHDYFPRSFVTIPDKGLESLYWQKIYPLLRRSVNFYLHMVEEEEDGTLRLPPTFSPELGVFADCNFDLALFKWGCHTLLTASERLRIDDPLIPRWKQVVHRLPDYPVDEHGYMLGRNRSSSANHQHFSNLLMIYPLYLVNREQPGTADVMRRSFDRARATAGPGQRQAMVQAHAGPIATALGLGDEALDRLQRLAGDLLPNGLWYDPPCLESSLAAANIVQEMLLQSWSDPAAETPGPIRVFPAVPTTWQNVEFRDLQTEGAFLVSPQLENSKTKWVRIKSLAGEPCRARPNFDGPFDVKSERTLKLTEISPGTYDFDLKKGEEVVLIRVAGP